MPFYPIRWVVNNINISNMAAVSLLQVKKLRWGRLSQISPGKFSECSWLLSMQAFAWVIGPDTGFPLSLACYHSSSQTNIRYMLGPTTCTAIEMCTALVARPVAKIFPTPRCCLPANVVTATAASNASYRPKHSNDKRRAITMRLSEKSDVCLAHFHSNRVPLAAGAFRSEWDITADVNRPRHKRNVQDAV